MYESLITGPDTNAPTPAATPAASPGGSGPEQFVRDYLPLAEKVAAEMGVSPDALLGQWGMETGWGKSVIPGTNNLGNIKDFSGRGAQATDNMTGSRDAYLRFATPDDFGTHYTGLMGRKYKTALNAGEDHQKFFSELKRGGYAEDPAYVEKGVKAAGMVARVRGSKPAAAAATPAGDGKYASLITPPEGETAAPAYYKPSEGRYASLITPPEIERSALAAVNDTVNETANAVVGGVKAVSDFIAPGNPVSQIAEGLIRTGEAAQSDAVKAQKARLASEMEGSGKWDEEVMAYLGYAARNPVLAAAQAAGSFALPGGAVKAAGWTARLAGAGNAGVTRAGLAGGAAAGTALGGGDAAGTAYELVMRTPDEVIAQSDDAKALLAQGLPITEVKEQLATSAAREASKIPAVVGAASGMVGAERLLAGVGRGGGRAVTAAKGVAVEAPAEAFEEGITTREGRLAAAKYDPSIDPNKGVAGAAAAGAVSGGVTGGAIGALTGAKPVPPELQPVADKAAEPDSPLSRAALAGNTGPAAEAARAAAQTEAAAAAAPVVDPLADKVNAIAETLRQPGVLDTLRAKESPVDVKSLLKDLAAAKSPSTLPQFREQALNRLEFALEWAGVNPAPTATSAVEQIVGDAPGVNTAIPMDPPAPTEAAYDDTVPAERRAEAAREQGDANLAAASREAPKPPVDDVIAALRVVPALRSAEQSAIVKQAEARYSASEMRLINQATTYAAGMSATDKIQFEALRGTGSPAIAVGTQAAAAVAPDTPAPAAATPAGPAAVAKPIATPAGEGPAVFRKRRAVLSQVIGLGLNRIGRNDEGYYLTDGKKEFRLEGPADAQLARKVIGDAVRAGAERANLSPTQAQKEAGNYKKGRVEFDGFKIGIENPKDSVRSGIAPDGTEWSVQMPANYGDITGTTGADGDGVDVYLADNPRPGAPVFVIDQYNDDGSFDETKSVLGVATEAEALRLYDAGFSDGSGPRRRRAVTAMTAPEFKAWAVSPAAKKAAGETASQPSAAADGAAGSSGVGDISKPSKATVHEVKPTPAKPARQGKKPNAVLVTVDGKPVELETVKAEDLGSESLRRDGAAVTVSKKDAALLQRIARMLGKEVVFFKDPDNEVGDGFIEPDDAKTLYLKESTTINPLAVLGHEFFHQVQRDMPRLWNSIAKVVAARMQSDAARAYYGQKLGYAEGGILEELTSDLGGDLLADPTFWRELFAQIEKDHPNNSKGFVAALAQIFYDLVDKLVAGLKGERLFGAEQFVTDMDAVRAAFKGGLATYIANSGVSRVALQADILRARQDAKKSVARPVTETEAFKRWFGDSKITSKSGKPLPMYHGTDAQFDEYRTPSYFTRSAADARNWGELLDKVFLSIQNPVEIDDYEAFSDFDDDAVSAFEREGYDGAIHRTGSGAIHMAIAFRPAQIKSAIDNNGEFDANNGDVTRSAPRPAKSGDNPADVLVNDDGANGAAAGSPDAPSARYGKPQAGSTSVVGVHFSRNTRKSLSSSAYGTGYKGAESKRLAGSENDDIRPRTFFYVDKGLGVRPEDGVGAAAHRVRLDNVYDATTDALRLVRDNGGANNWERAIMRAGFDGYLSLDPKASQGFVVLIGSKHQAIPVEAIAAPGHTNPVPAEPEVLKKGLMSKELGAIDLARIPGATLRAGTLSVPADSREAANDELARIGSSVRLSVARPVEAVASEAEAVAEKYRGTDQWMKAPDGTATKLNERQWLHVRTPAFKAWFGDWEKFAGMQDGVWGDDKGEVSKAVGKNGEPLVVYHGSDSAGFAAFERPGGRDRGDLGIFTTDDWQTARSYVTTGRAKDVEEGDINDDGDKVRGIYALFVNLRNPGEEDFEGANWSGERFDQYNVILPTEEEPYTDASGNRIFDQEAASKIAEENDGDVVPADGHWGTTDDAVRQARRDGHDGAIIRAVVDSGSGADVYEPSNLFVAFDPSQVKSADFNAGEYSVSKDDIRMSRSRLTAGQKIAARIARRLDLSPQEVASTSLEMQTGLPKGDAFSATPVGGIPEVIKFLEERRLASDLPPLDLTREADRETLSKLLAAEALAAINGAGSALEWYDATINTTLERMALRFPELKSDPQARTAFVLIMAVTSQGLNVENNLGAAIGLYDEYRQTGKFPERGEGESAAIMVGNFKLLNDLREEMGPELMARFFKTEFTVGELKRAGFKVGGELIDEKVLGSSVLGPKIGFGFFSNLTGNFSPVTMDMWFMRTIGRLTGKLRSFDSKKFAKQTARFMDALRETGNNGIYAADMDPDMVLAAATQIENDEGDMEANEDAIVALAREVNRRHQNEFIRRRAEFDSGAREKTELVFAAGNIVKSMDKPKDAPASGGERRLLRDVVRRTVEKVSKAHRRKVPAASLQALIWYPEQELYKALGVKLSVTSQDYAGAALKILKEGGIDEQQLLAAGKPGPGAARQDDAGNDGRAAQEPGVVARPIDALKGRGRKQFLERRVEQESVHKLFLAEAKKDEPAEAVTRAGAHDPRSSESHPAAEDVKRSAPRGGRDANGNLGGLPTKVAVKGLGEIEVGHWAPAETVAREYMAAAGLPYTPPAEFVKVDRERAERIAAAYDAMPHAPQDPAVKAAYAALIDEVTAQYQAVLKTGLKVEFIDFGKQGDPYAASPRQATEDVRDNNHMWVFGTRDGFGSTELDVSDNPMLAETRFEISGQPALANDLFRVVHDYFGHVKEGLGFRAAQPLSSKVLTPSGWRRMGDIQIGDEIVNPDGGTSRVQQIHPHGLQKVYAVTFNDGSVARADAHHRWKVRWAADEKWQMKRTFEIAEFTKSCSRRLSVPMVEPVEFIKRDLPLDPYVLGALLGDGHFNSSITFFSDDEELADRLIERLPESVSVLKRKERNEYAITTGNGSTSNPVRAAITELGLRDARSHTKFIPEAYKLSSSSDRLEVLRGLMDTDGNVNFKKGVKYTNAKFRTVSRQLAEDVQFLAQSLGGTARIITSAATTYQYLGEERAIREIHTVGVNLPHNLNPFALSRKADALVRGNGPARAIVSVEEMKSEEVQCITVDAANELYVTDHFVVTMNSGEENAWRAHSAMFTPLARRALTSETRGQNSWVNFGKFGEQNRSASAGDTHYADQKVGLLPQWAVEDGASDVTASKARAAPDTAAFKEWFGDSKVVDADGRPLVVYHGTQNAPTAFARSRVGGASTILGSYEVERHGIFAAESSELAEEYANQGERPTGQAVMPLYMRVESPLDTVDGAYTDAIWNRIEQAAQELGADNPYRTARYIGDLWGRGELWKMFDADEHQNPAWNIALFRKAGYDGLRILERSEGDVGNTAAWVAFDPDQIKSATGNDGGFDPASNDITRSVARPIFYSQLELAIEEVPERLGTMAAAQWKLWLDANAPKFGVKKDEIEWSGVKDYLSLRGKDKVTRDELAAWVRENWVKVSEVVLHPKQTAGSLDHSLEQWAEERGEDNRVARGILMGDSWEQTRRAAIEDGESEVVELIDRQHNQSKFGQYAVLGGSNYREVLLTLPTLRAGMGIRATLEEKYGKSGSDLYRALTDEERGAWDREKAGKRVAGDSLYQSSHWDQPNVLAHLRVDDRTDADGNKVLFINEIQSDWGQQAKKDGFTQPANSNPTDDEVREYFGLKDGADPADYREEMVEREARIAKNRGVPRGPFVGKTESWVALALKRAITMAVDGGYEKIAFVTGEQAADFFDLSKQIGAIDYRVSGDANYRIAVYDKVGQPLPIAIPPSLSADGLEQYVGKEMAQKIVDNATNKEQSFSGLDLKVGGEGMKAFYGKIVPQVANDVLKKLGGGKVGEVQIGADKEGWHITPPEQTTSGKWMLKSSDYNSKGQHFGTEAEARAALEKRLDRSTQPGFSITDSMREKLAGGAPMFSKRRDAEQTPAFKAWFGDSKVVDDAGRPLVVYHGTNAKFNRFDDTKVGQNYPMYAQKGFFFYSGYQQAAEHALENDRGLGTTPRVKKVFLSLRNPLVRTSRSYGPPETWFDLNNEALYAAAAKTGADGIIVRSHPNAKETYSDLYIAFAADQIKSATENDGNFDPASSDITRSVGRDTALMDGYKIADFLDSSKKITWWDKTVGTPYHLAERHPSFKRVYDAVQRSLGDVSKYATRAADLAPNILPKLETLKDAFKSPLAPEDLKALSDPIFKGTLSYTRDAAGDPVLTNDVGLAGVVWTDAELRDMWHLKPAQIKLYREFRKATNKSIADMAVTHMVRYAGSDGEGVRGLALAAPTVQGAADILADHLGWLAANDPGRANTLMNTARALKEIADMSRGLMAKGYAPLSRFGDYTVYVTRNGGAEQVYFGMYETEREANRAARAFREDPQFAGAVVQTGTMSKEAHKLFKGITPETLALFGEALGLEESASDRESQVFQEFLKTAKANRSAMKHMIERKGVAGYSEDAGRVLASFVYSNARQAAMNLNAGEVIKSASEVPEGDLKDHAIRLTEYVQNPAEEAQALRGLLFAQYIGGSVASAAVNLTQSLTTTWPTLSMHFGIGKAGRAMGDAIGVVNKGAGADTDLAAAMKKAEESGITAPQETHQLQGQAAGRGTLRSGDGTRLGNTLAKMSNGISKTQLIWGKMFGWAEITNRKIAFVAAYRLAREKGLANPYEFAVKIVADTQYTLNKGNNPHWARGPVGATLFTFKKFSVNYVEGLARMYGNGPEGKKAFALSLAIMFMVAGVGGFPFAEDLDDIVDAFAQRVLNKSFNSKAEKKAFFAKIVGDAGAEFVMNGGTSLPGMPIDLSGRLGLGNLVPGTGMLPKKRDYQRDVAEIGGAAGDFTKRMLTGTGEALRGNARGAMEAFMPIAASNAYKAKNMAELGYYADLRGRKVIDTTLSEALLKAIGFQPQSVNRLQDAAGIEQSLISQNKLRESEIADLWAKGKIQKKPELVADAKAQLAAWNKANPSSPINIDQSQINKRVQAANQTKAQRIAKTAPKEIREAVRQVLAKEK